MGCREVSKYILLGLTVLAWILSIVSIAGCTFVQVGGVKVGLFKSGYDGISCEPYPSGNDFSGALTTARAFGVLLTLGLSAAMVIVMVVVLVHPHPVMWITFRVLLGLCFVFNQLTFVAFAECVDQDLRYLSCSVGGASVCAILNSWILLPISILSCCIPAPEEPVFKIGSTNSNNNMIAGSQTVKRTIREMPDGKKITEEVTDASGRTTVTTTFEPNQSSCSLEIDGFDVGPTVRTMVSDLPNGKKIVEEDAKGNQTITTKVIVMASDSNLTQSTTQYGDDPEIVVANKAPQYNDSSGEAVMFAAAVIPPVGRGTNAGRSYDGQDEERGLDNPYIDHGIQEHVNRQVNSEYEQSSSRTSRSKRSSRPKSSKHGRSRGQADDHDDGTAKPIPPPSKDMSGYAEDSVSSAFPDSNTFGTNSSSTLDNSFMDSSGNFDSSFAPNDSTALDGAAQHRPKKKKKKKKHHKSHRHDGEHREHRSKKQHKKEGSDDIGEVEREKPQQEVAASEVGPYE
jgi:hypothetical protein